MWCAPGALLNGPAYGNMEPFAVELLDDLAEQLRALPAPPARVVRAASAARRLAGFSGEAPCEVCAKRAYFRAPVEGGRWALLCGRHAPREAREKLPKRPAAERRAKLAAELARHTAGVEAARRATGGRVTLQRLRMLRQPALTAGAVIVLPNNRHGTHPMAAFDCSALSPMRLGPVEHGQPGLPPARNIENFHQGSKCFREEVDKEGNPTELFVRNRLRFYLDPEPHRHKYRGLDTKNRNVPLFFVWRDRTGREHRLSYVESRQFYCEFYSRLAAARPEFGRLQGLLRDGYDVEICGYDAHPFDPTADAEHAYCDAALPFGHERVLAVMLVCRPSTWPWRRHKTFEF